MKKVGLVLVVMALSLWVRIPQVEAGTYFIEDGLSHTINDATHASDRVYLDNYTALTPGTQLNLVDGGTIDNLYAWHNSQVNMTGGKVHFVMWAGGDASITMSGGIVESHLEGVNSGHITFSGGIVEGTLSATTDSHITMTGGVVNGYVHAQDNGVVNISGGHVMSKLEAIQNGTIYLNGTGFQVNGISLVNGDKLSNFGTLVEAGDYDYYFGTITGILADGTSLNSNEFYILNTGACAGTGDIIIIPEPLTLGLLAMGGVVLARRRK